MAILRIGKRDIKSDLKENRISIQEDNEISKVKRDVSISTDDEFSSLKREIHSEIMKIVDLKNNCLSAKDRSLIIKKTSKDLDALIEKRNMGSPLSSSVKKDLLDEIFGYGPINELLDDTDVTEIMVNGPDQIYVEINGKIVKTCKKFISERTLISIVKRIVNSMNRRIDETVPFVDSRMHDGSRINAIIPPISLSGPSITIRKFSSECMTEEDLISKGTIDKESARYLEMIVKNRANIIIAGGTGSGKTTMLNVISSYIPNDERIITIEDSAELKLNKPHVVSLECRPKNLEGRGEITIRDLVRNSLRMRPDRLIIGECRGEESLDMLQAMNTGHDGSMTTGHANSPRDILSRLETMVLFSGLEIPSKAVREQIASALDVIIYITRMGSGERKVSTISEISGISGTTILTQDIFSYDKDTKKIQHTGIKSKFGGNTY